MPEYLSRGKAIALIAGIPVAAALTAAAVSAADTAQATKTKASLGYIGKSATKGQTCANCSFFVATSGGAGTCKIIPGGTVKAAGWCKSWAK